MNIKVMEDLKTRCNFFFWSLLRKNQCRAGDILLKPYCFRKILLSFMNSLIL